MITIIVGDRRTGKKAIQLARQQSRIVYCVAPSTIHGDELSRQFPDLAIYSNESARFVRAPQIVISNANAFEIEFLSELLCRLIREKTDIIIEGFLPSKKNGDWIGLVTRVCEVNGLEFEKREYWARDNVEVGNPAV